ncbi:MAG: patatin-like phospholipase family protein [Polyangiaceae bacterium]
MSSGQKGRLRQGSIGLVLSGGGARGAYEVGVLKYIADSLPHLLDRVSVITGTSVGAVNAMHLASYGLSRTAVNRLTDLWSHLKIDELIGVAPLNMLRMVGTAPLRFVKRGMRSPAAGLLRADPLWKLIARETDWVGLGMHLARGRFDAVAVAGTDIQSGDTHLWVQGTGETVRALTGPTPMADFVAVPSKLGLRHVLASAAIPLLFPPIQIGGKWFMDGGVRHNTPLGPALRFGAESLLVVSVRGERTEDVSSHRFPGIGQVVGKLLDSIFLDRVAFDLDRLQRINDVVLAAESLGPEEAMRFHAKLVEMGRPNYRPVSHAAVSPSEDLGLVAARAIRESEQIPNVSFIRVLSALFEDDERSSGDAASFLLFDGRFTRQLIDLGMQDAARQHDELAAL